MIKEAIILAGGLGTRLREAVPDLPKCMASVADRPFVSYVIDYLRMQGLEHFIFSLGYKAEAIEAYLAEHYPTLYYSTTVENEPLGTGGGIQLALSKSLHPHVLIVNGDTLFKIDGKTVYSFHQQHNAECTLALKSMQQFDRYGVVEVRDNGRIESFKEKQFYKEGLINGGVYILAKEKFLQRSFPQKFSFEKDYLETLCKTADFFGAVQDGYFIDIGMPSDYQQAQTDLQRPLLDLKTIDRSWTLFLDRDGVINEERVDHYVLNPDEFHFAEGALDAFQILAQRFGKIVIVSNQRGVGKGLMSENDLAEVHKKMQAEISNAGGRIDKIYYCTDVNDTHSNRKPNPGMALQATIDFPEINLSKSIIVGNKPSDMKFGRAAGMFTVFVTTTNPHQTFPHPDIDLKFESLFAFSKVLS